MNKSIKIITLLLTSVLISSCATDGRSGINKQGGGTVLGAVAGGILGAQFGKGDGRLLATAAGALIGAYAGNQIGKSMDAQDKMLAERTSQSALESQPSGVTSTWQNPDTGHKGYVTPTRTFKNNLGTYCREFTQEVIIGNEREKAYGTACRQPDGSWKIQGQ
jgi:surface antigen